jgi:formylglycine-generating enzyme required for sulfatase activity
MNLRRNRILLSGLVGLAAVSHGHGQACSGDLGGDGRVDGVDLAILLAEWGPCAKSCTGDINDDGQVDGVDIAEVLAGWGYCPMTWATILEHDPDPAVVTDPALRQAIIASGRPWRVRDNASQIEMLLVPPGVFQMGCSAGDGGCVADEYPAHPVTLVTPLYLGRFEVRQSEWSLVMGSNPSGFQCCGIQNRPVEQVSWTAVQVFNAATGLRLPTEAEWEFACRAGTTTPFYSGSSASSLDGIAWYSVNSWGYTHPVGWKAPNRLGFFDMAGNVFEWVNDWYGPTYYQSSDPVDPKGPRSGSQKVVRGGSFAVFHGYCRTSARLGIDPEASMTMIGFRVARNP